MEKQILFNTEMVQAILAGRKTSTRRVIKPQPKNVDVGPNYVKPFACWVDCTKWIKSPYQVGDTLWVRETWNNLADDDGDNYVYRADGGWEELSWHPSIHMPRAAARIFLKVTDVKVQRMQDITEDGALKEGIEERILNPKAYELNGGKKIYNYADGSGTTYSVLEAFKKLWNSTIKKCDLDRYGWDSNPWVWVISFERLEGDKCQ